MIRVYLYPKKEFPQSLINTVAAFPETECVKEPAAADVLLSYAAVYNQVTLSTIHDIRKKFPMPVLMVYEKVADSFLRESVSRQEIAGAIRYASTEQLSVALHAVATGLRVFSQNDVNPHGPPFEGMSLTSRELEILRLIADGEGNKSIAYLLEISEHTVKFHVSSIFAKLHASSRTEAIKKGIQRGFISI